LCYVQGASDLTLINEVGSVLRWEISTSTDFDAPVVIASTSTTLDKSEIDNIIDDNLNITLYVRAIVQNGVCDEAPSDTIVIRYNNPDVVVMNDAIGFCTLTGTGKWTHIFDPITSRVIASINDNGTQSWRCFCKGLL
jgi:trimeric autotransporter adhesin